MDFFERKLDDKKRLTIPSELRHEFEGGRVILTKGFANYLHLYTEKVWNEEMEPALQGSILDERIADLNVQFRSGKSASSIDAKQGRITLESHLLEHAGIDKEVVAVRAGKYWRISAKQL
jgi:MraZ protein